MLTYSTIHESSSLSSYSSSSSFGTKREQLPFLQKSYFSRAKAALWHFFGFAFSTYPIFPLFTKIVTIIREIQFIIPSLFLSIETMYPKGSFVFDVARVLSFPIRIIPIGYSITLYRILGWILFGLFLCDFLILISFMMVFSRKSELPKYFSYYLVVVNVSIGNILKPILMTVATILITSKDRLSSDLDLSIFLYILFLIFSVMDLAQNIASLYFFPQPFVTCRQHCQSYINILIPVICMISELVNGVSFPSSNIIFPVIMIALYAFLGVFITYMGIFIQKWEKISFLTAMTSSILFCISSMIFNLTKKEVPLYVPLIYVGIYIIVYVIYEIFFQRMDIKSLIFLDEMEKSPETEINNVSIRHLNHIIIAGCNAGHQYCISFAVFRDIIEIYPRSSNALILFAKFLAIYPEESHQLSWVLMKIKKCDCSKYMRKYLTSQITALLMKRDTSLSIELKKKMQVISSLIVTAKLRIRNALESSMNGNTGKLISLFSKATTVIDQTNIRFANLRSYHQSNQYALFLQASFTKDVLGDYKLADQLREMAHIAQSGKLSTVDQPYRYGRLYFPNFPSKLSSPVSSQADKSLSDKASKRPSAKNTVNATERTNTNTNTDGQNLSSQFSDYKDISGKFDFTPEMLNLHSQIKASIDSIKIPSIKHSIFYFVGNVIILALIPLIVNAAIFPTLSNMISNPAKYLTVVTQSISTSMTAYFACIRYRVELSNNIIQSTCPNPNNVSEQLGGTCDVKEQLIYFSNRALKSLSGLPLLQLSTSNNADLKNAQNIIFTKQTTFQEFENWTISTPVQRTPFNELLNLLETMITIASKDRDEYSINHKYFANIIRNFDDVLSYLHESGEYLTEFLYSQVETMRGTFNILRLVVIISCSVLNIIFLVIYSVWLSSNQQVIFNSFTALPKSTVAQMMQKLEVLSRKSAIQQSATHQGSSTTDTNLIDDSTEKNNQTEKIISILHTSQNDFYNSNIVYLICLFVVITAFEAVFLYLTFTLYISGSDSYMRSTPHIQTIVTSLVDIQKLAATLTLYSNHQNHIVEVIDKLNNTFMDTFNSCKKNFHLFYFGNYTMSYDPIISTTKSLFLSLLKEPEFNADSESIDDLFVSFPYDLMFYYLIDKMKKLYSTTFLIDIDLDPQSEELTRILNILIYNLYPEFFLPLYRQFTIEVSELISKKFTVYYSVSVVMVVLIVIALIFMIVLLIKIRKQMISVLRILLLAPPNVIISSRYIMMLLSGIFSIPQQSLATLDDGSFSTVIEEFPSCIIKCDTKGTVIKMNKAAKRIIGTKIKKIKLDTTRDRLELNHYVLSKSVFVTDNYAYVILRDITSEDKYMQKIKEEEQKHDELLKIILPQGVLEGRDGHNRFAATYQIQTTTILALYIDAPSMHSKDHRCELCESVIQKLQEMQQLYPAVDYLDVNMSYLIAGTGFFKAQFTAEIAASQMLHFATSALAFCKELKNAKKEEITVQAGMITGGPVVSGVIMVNKVPHFEIIGEIVEYAKSMANLSPNFTIHLARSTYELVYGSGFDVREVGGIKVPLLGSIVTYTISI